MPTPIHILAQQSPVYHYSSPSNNTEPYWYMAELVDDLGNDTSILVGGFLSLIGFIGVSWGFIRIAMKLQGAERPPTSWLSNIIVVVVGGGFLFTGMSIALAARNNIDKDPDTSSDVTETPITTAPSEPVTPPTPREPIAWDVIALVLGIGTLIVILMVLLYIIFNAYSKHSLAKRKQQSEIAREKAQHELDNPTVYYRDLHSRMKAHHRDYTYAMVSRSHELMLTMPALFDVTLPEAIAYEDIKREVTLSLDGWSDDSIAPPEKITLIDDLLRAWATLRTKAKDIGLRGLSEGDKRRIKKLTNTLIHSAGMSKNEYDMTLAQLIKLYDKIYYTVKNEHSDNTGTKRIYVSLDGLAITANQQFTLALTTAGNNQRRALEMGSN